MIVHLGTEVKTLFAVVDAEGNVVKEIPLQARLSAVEPDQLANIGAQMQMQRKKLEAEDSGKENKD